MKLTTALLSFALAISTASAQGVNYRGNLTLTGRSAIDAAGSLAYATAVNHFAIVDVSNPSAPVLRGQVTLDAPSITGLEVWGNYAFCAGQNYGLMIINVTTPTAPAWVTNQALASAARDVAVFDTLVAVATATNVTLVGVRNPADPNILATFPRSSSWIEFDGPSQRLHVGSTTGAFALDIDTNIGGGDTTFNLSLFDQYGTEILTPLAFAGAYANVINAVHDANVRVINGSTYTLAGQYTSTAVIQAIASAPGYSLIGLTTAIVQYLDQRAPTPVFLDAATVPAQVTGLALTYSGNQSLVVVSHAAGVAVLDYDALAADPVQHPAIPGELLMSAYPNPFNGTATLTLAVPQSGSYRLKLFDSLGREILNRRLFISGELTQRIDFSDRAAGHYFARLSGASGETSLRLIYLP